MILTQKVTVDQPYDENNDNMIMATDIPVCKLLNKN